ncbi:MAG: 30S ribosomal protein S8 [Candidatus Omnitrophica bacterium]|nr:30S ribosomal protein S8 [Candidatus Omnitrophota bacterium]MDD5487384.1 30S ribosomal protein S8 [Candidatus Omnitrophota bacterium]
MSVTDLIADQLTVIRNAIMVKKKTVIIKRSGIIEGIMGILKKEGFIDNYQVIEDNKQGKIKVYLKYTEGELPVMENLKKISKPGLKTYISAKDVKNIRGGVGLAIYSTSKGLLTDKEAKEQGIGGELICQVW